MAGLAMGLGLVPLARAQKVLAPEEFDKLSLQYRTALHYDPLIEAPLDSLVKLYVGAGRIDELVGTYRSHVEQYPDDAGAKATLIRILRKVDRSGADELISSAIQLHPAFSPLQYLYFQFLEEKGDPRATEALARAIQLEGNLARKRKWLDDLLQLSDNEETRAIAAAQLDAILSTENLTAESLLELARLAQRYQFWEQSAEALNRAKAVGLSPEDTVEADLLLAKSLAETGNRADAGRILDSLLSKLAPDYWRRREIMSLRVSVVANQQEREELLDRFRKQYEAKPEDETRVLDYAEMLAASEQLSEAANVLIAGAGVLPKSARIEARAIELLESLGDYAATKAFLEKRLEENPDRSDLRFELVKADYALGNDADADQDFRTVVAGLKPEEASAKILELQRFLRSIDRIEAAGKYLERYVRNFPAHLDVARELLEIYLATEETDRVPGLVSQLDIKGAATENALDLADFLIGNEFPVPARDVLLARLSVEPDNFDLGLLLVEVLGELGDQGGGERQIARLREAADTTARYKAWLDAAIAANEKFETLSRFFDEEQNRFSFSDGKWDEDKIEKFLLLGEAGKRVMQTDRITREIQDRLKQPGLEAALKVRLRKFLVGLFSGKDGAEPEVENQLKILEKEDPDNLANYTLERALLYYRGQRMDLAGQLLDSVNYEDVSSPNLLRDAVPALIEFEFFQRAEQALSVINRLVPEDVFSWEKRLSLLAATGEEQAFRTVIRTLRNGETGMRLRDLSRDSLLEHLIGSYWRSIAGLLANSDSENVEEVLPMLASIERESNSPHIYFWTEWCRAYVLTVLKRSNEAQDALKRFDEIARRQSMADVQFPDGLVLAVSSSATLLDRVANSKRPLPGRDDASFLLSNVELKWGFEIAEGFEIASFYESNGYVVVLDTSGSVHTLDLKTGKLLWSEQFGSGGGGSRTVSADLFENLEYPTPTYREPAPISSAGRAVSGFTVVADRIFLLGETSLNAYSVPTGELLWEGELPLELGRNSKGPSLSGSGAGAYLAANSDFAVVLNAESDSVVCFDSESGKLLWNRSKNGFESDDIGFSAVNTGLSLSEDLVFAYGTRPCIYDAETGVPMWVLDGGSPAPFPIVLRETKEVVEEEETETSATEEGKGSDWRVGAPASGVSSSYRAIDFFSPLSGRGALLSGAFNESSGLVGPATYWAADREGADYPAYAALGAGDLWLMGKASVRRVSTILPVASHELPAEGVFIGALENHAWFLSDGYLVHSDFLRNRVTRLSISELGHSSQIRTCMAGNQIVLRGRGGFVVVNALTGTVLGKSVWPEPLITYLGDQLAGEGDVISEPVWQGRVVRRDRGRPGYLFPVQDRIAEKRYITSFGRRCLACLGEPSAVPQ